MKKLIVITIVMVMALAVSAYAVPDTTWAIQLRALNAAGAGAGNITLGTTATAVDAFTTVGAQDAYLPVLSGSPGEISSTIATRASKDMRAPVTSAHSVTWDLIMFNNGPATTITLTGWVAAGTNGIIAGSSEMVVTLRQGSTILWTVPHDVSGSQAAPQFTQQFVWEGPDPISLQLVAEAPVPEPGSMVALFSGLVGLVGFGIRRRK